MPNKDKVTKQDKTRLTSQITPSSLLRSCVCTFLTCKDIEAVTAQTEFGVISFTRKSDVKGSCHAVGFNADIDACDDYDDSDDVINEYWGLD